MKPTISDTKCVKASKSASKAASDLDFDGIVLFRALGYIVGLPCFIVGTALFMLGFSTTDGALVGVASLLYSVALTAIGGRKVLARFEPTTEWQALVVGASSLGAILVLYALLNTIFWALHLTNGFEI